MTQDKVKTDAIDVMIMRKSIGLCMEGADTMSWKTFDNTLFDENELRLDGIKVSKDARDGYLRLEFDGSGWNVRKTYAFMLDRLDKPFDHDVIEVRTVSGDARPEDYWNAGSTDVTRGIQETMETLVCVAAIVSDPTLDEAHYNENIRISREDYENDGVAIEPIVPGAHIILIVKTN